MAKKKRISRKKLLKEPDEFLTFSARTIRFVVDNQRPVLGILIGVVVVILAFAGFKYFSNLSEKKAYAMFEQGHMHYMAEKSQDKKTPDQEKAAEYFEKVILKYPSTDAARFSLLVYADMSYHNGAHQKAIELYKKALDAFPGEGLIQKLIWNGLAYTYEAQNDYNSASKYFQMITETQDGFIKADAYYNLGRTMDALNHQDKALEAYKKVVEAYPDSVGFKIANEKVIRLKGATEASE